MLVESWHYLFKGTFVEGKRNRRLDHLIHVLYDVAVPHSIARHRRQEMGFEGPDLEIKHRIEITRHASSIPMSDIQRDPDTGKYIVRSQSDREIFYEVDLDAYDCTSLSFPLIRFCKHICAVENHFPEEAVKIPVAALNATDSDDGLDTPEVSEGADDSHGSDAEDSDSDDSDLIVEDLTERLQFLALRFRFDPPVEAGEDARQSMRHVSEILDLLSAQLPLSRAILPSKKQRIESNQGSQWGIAKAVMGNPVKNKKRKDYGPYGGNEASGKKAQLDARGPSSDEPVASQIPADLPSSHLAKETSYYRPRAHALPPAVAGPLLPASNRVARAAPHSRPSFDVDTFDLAKLDDDTVDILSSLNANQLRGLCVKYDVETTRKNEVMVVRLRAHRLRLQNRPQLCRPVAMPSAYPFAYPPYQYHPNLPAVYPGNRPAQ
ncbi:hypothetical protein B0H19DRAFT_1275272 [Mycena capillaripes]|nr:hypothetical protein B0H19DRAFT_1275272 [Mycena capillaripes]